MKKNKFSKALKHIKKDLKEVAPTNSMSGVYSLNDPGFSLQQVSAPKRFLPDVDGNFPSGIPGNAGDSSYVRPAGIWTGEVDWDTVTQPNFGNSRVGDDGTNTSTLIDESTGTVLTALPPNSRSFILGPLVDGFVYNHLSDAYTKIGYIQKDTRQFVLLAQITGTWSANWPTDSTGNYSGTNFNVWNGTSTGFTAYNSSFTLAMAQWMRTEILAGRFMKNVSYFQSGGVSQPQLPAGGGLPSGMYGGGGVGAGAGDAAGDGGIGDGYGSGGEPNIGTKQGNPASGDAEDAGFPWFPFGALGQKAKELWDKITDAVGDIKDNLEEFFDDAFDDAVEGAKDFRDSLQSSLDDVKAGLDAKSDWSVKDWLDHAAWYTAGGGISQEVNDFLNDHFTDSLGKDGTVWEFKDTIGNAVNDAYNWLEENTAIGAHGNLNPLFDTIANTVTETVGEMTHDVLNLQSSANFLSQFNQNAALPEDQRATYDNPIDLTNSLANNDLNALNNVVNSSNFQDAKNDFMEIKNSGIDGNLIYDGALESAKDEMIRALETAIYSPNHPGLNNTIHNNADINWDHLAETGEVIVTKTYDFNEGGSVEPGEDNVLPQIISNISNIPLDAFGTSGYEWIAAIAGKFGLSQADEYNGILNMPAMPYQIQLDGNIRESFVIEEKKSLNIKKQSKSKIRNKIRDQKKKLEHGRFNLFDAIPQFDNPPPKKKVKESYGLRKVKFVMEDVAAAPAPTTPTNQTTTQQPTESKQTADALAKEYIEKNGPEKTQELIDKTDEYLSAHGAGEEPSPHTQSDVDKETVDQEVESDINANDELDQDQKETHKKNWGIVAAANRKIDADSGKDKNIYNSKVDNNFKIAHSILQNRVVDHTYPPNLINDYFKSYITLGRFLGDPDLAAQQQGASYYTIPIVSKEMGYADDNIWVDEQGGINNNTSDTQQMVNRAALAYDNGFKEIGQGMSQLVIPSDGGVPYVIFKDYNYHNLRSNDPGEVPNIILDGLSGIIHGKSWIKDVLSGSISKSLGSGWPEGIHGAAYTTFKRNLDQLDPSIQNMIKVHPLYWTDGRYGELFGDKEAFDEEYRIASEKMSKGKNTKDIFKKINDELWKMDADDKHIGSNPEINDVMNRFNTEYDEYQDEIKKVQDDFWRGGPNNRGVHGDLTQEWMDQWESWKTDRPNYEDWDGYKEDQRLTDEFRKYHKSVGGTIDADGTYRASISRAEGKIWQEKFDAFNRGTMDVYDRFNETVAWPYDDEVFAKLDEIKKRQNDAREAYENEFKRLNAEQDALLPKFTEEWNPVWEAHQREQLKLYHSTIFDKVYAANGAPSKSFVPSGPTPINYKQYDYKDAFSIGAGTPGGIGGTGDAATAADLAGERKKKKNNQVSVEVYKPKGRRLQESDLNLSRRQVRLLKEIKKPVLVEELPQQKLKKYKPNFKGKFSPQNTPDKTASKESDALVMSGNQKGQAWRMHDKYWSGYETQERMNVISDRVGHGQMAWDMIIDEARKKNGWKNREIQEQLNQIAHDKAMKDLHSSYESPFGYVIHEQGASTEEELDTVMKDPLVKKVSKRLRTQIDYKDKPSRKGFPDEPPAKQQDGWHPEYGKKYKYDKLDPQSAEAMPPTGNPEIDANVEKVKPKKPRWKHINTESKVDPKVKWQESVDWRNEIEIPEKKEELVEEKKTLFSKVRHIELEEAVTNSTSGVLSGGQIIASAGDTDLQNFQTGLTGDGGIDFGETGVYDSTHTGVGEFTAYTNMGDMRTVEDPTGVGPMLRAVGYDFTGSGSNQSVDTGITGFAPGIPGYKSYSHRNMRPSGQWDSHHYDNYAAIHGSTVDSNSELGKGWNEVGTYLQTISGTHGWWSTNDIDTSELDTIKLHALVSSNKITSAGEQLQVYYWAGNKPGFQSVANSIYAGGGSNPGANKPNDGWRPLYQKPDGTIDTSVNHIIIPTNRPAENNNKVSVYTQNIPEWARGKNSRFIFFGAGSQYGMTSLRFQRKNPIVIGQTLDSPEATSFVRLGQGNNSTSPEERKKKVEDMLKASRAYLLQILGYADFPGMGASLDSIAASPTTFDEVGRAYADTLGSEERRDYYKFMANKQNAARAGNAGNKSKSSINYKAAKGKRIKSNTYTYWNSPIGEPYKGNPKYNAR